MKELDKPLVLLSPLDWGLGHTTRSIPLIAELLALDCRVIVACNSRQKKLLSAEFPQIGYEDLEGYEVSYGAHKATTLLKIILQLPKNLMIVKRERNWLRAYLQTHPVNLVISDNRFGFQNNQVTCIFITHQLTIRTRLGRMADWLAQKINYRFINRFNQCWVPDSEGNNNLAGVLSHPLTRPAIPLHYAGPVTRFKSCSAEVIPGSVLVILSGPEPQRSILEKIILTQAIQFNISIQIVRGLPGEEALPRHPAFITMINHLAATALNLMICQAEFIICRPGYTSVMDLVALDKKSIFIPTPGQGEQEYLAEHLHARGITLSFQQDRFQLKRAIEQAARYGYQKIGLQTELYKSSLRTLMMSVSK